MFSWTNNSSIQTTIGIHFKVNASTLMCWRFVVQPNPNHKIKIKIKIIIITLHLISFIFGSLLLSIVISFVFNNFESIKQQWKLNISAIIWLLLILLLLLGTFHISLLAFLPCYFVWHIINIYRFETLTQQAIQRNTYSYKCAHTTSTGGW